jgi:hypothetical protein
VLISLLHTCHQKGVEVLDLLAAILRSPELLLNGCCLGRGSGKQIPAYYVGNGRTSVARVSRWAICRWWHVLITHNPGE